MILLLAFFLALTYISVILLVYIRKIKRFTDYGKKIPGPPAHPIFGNVSQLHKLEPDEIGDFFKSEARKCRTNGHNVMRLHLMGKMYFYPLDGAALKGILDSTTEITKGDDYGFLDPWLGGGVLFTDGERWRTHRKLLTPTFHFAKLEGYIDIFDIQSRILCEVLEENSRSGETVDLFPFIKRCTLDIICEAAMGKDLGCQFNSEHPYLQAVEVMSKMSMTYAFRPIFWIPIVYRLLGYEAARRKCLQTLKKFTTDTIKERREALAHGGEMERSKRRMNFLDLLLSVEETKSFTEEDLRQEVDTFMFAGHDTTSTSTAWALWCLACYPKIQEQVYQEIHQVYGDDDDRPVTIEDLKQLHYLDQVAREAKRCCAPVPFVQRKLQENMEIAGYTVPSGASIIIAPLVVHDNQQVYGETPEEFDPDHFTPEKIAARHPYDYIPFSAGVRNCIGQRFAQFNEKMMLVWVLRRFKLTPTIGFHETKRSPEVVTRPSKGIPVKLVRRNLR